MSTLHTTVNPVWQTVMKSNMWLYNCLTNDIRPICWLIQTVTKDIARLESLSSVSHPQDCKGVLESDKGQWWWNK